MNTISSSGKFAKIEYTYFLVKMVVEIFIILAQKLMIAGSSL